MNENKIKVYFNRTDRSIGTQKGVCQSPIVPMWRVVGFYVINTRLPEFYGAGRRIFNAAQITGNGVDDGKSDSFVYPTHFNLPY